MREKKVTDKTIEKYIEFLEDLKDCSNSDRDYSIEEMIKAHSINKSVIKPLERCNIIKRNSKYDWDWLEKEPNKTTVLELLDFVLHKTKPITQPPILPDWATQVTSLLKEISEKLTPHQTIEESSENRLKISERIYLAGKIASTIFKESFDYNAEGDMQSISRASDFIIKATDNLLLKLNSK